MAGSVAVAVVTDSAADLPADLASELAVEIVPLVVAFGAESFRDGELSPDEFWRRAAQTHPTTAAPSPAAFAGAYARCAAAGAEAVVSVHLSSTLSSVLANAAEAARQAPVPVRVVDSRSVGMGQGFVVAAAAKAGASGAVQDAVADAAVEAARRIEVFALIESVEFLRRGGRVGAVKAAVSELLRIRPVLTLTDGDPVLLAKCRTRGRAVEEILARAAEKPAEAAALSHALAPDAPAVAERLEAAVGVRPVVSAMGAATGSHLGSGAIAVAVVRPA